MQVGPERTFVEDLLSRNRYLVLSTTDGSTPWIAPLEYMMGDDLALFFLSTDDARHVRDIEENDVVSVAVFDQDQPQYSVGLSARLNGVQIEAVASRVPPEQYSEQIEGAIQALRPPMPPYAVFKIEPRRFYIPRLENGVNVRVEVQ